MGSAPLAVALGRNGTVMLIERPEDDVVAASVAHGRNNFNYAIRK